MSPLPRSMARFNRRVTNRLTRPVAKWLPGFGIVVHKGRASARTYETPVNVFRDGAAYVIALTYGSDSDWVKNVVAANGCELVYRGERLRLTAPRIVHDESRAMAAAIARPMLRLLDVADFMRLDASNG